jgi:hypothetical protein
MRRSDRRGPASISDQKPAILVVLWRYCAQIPKTYPADVPPKRVGLCASACPYLSHLSAPWDPRFTLFPISTAGSLPVPRTCPTGIHPQTRRTGYLPVPCQVSGFCLTLAIPVADEVFTTRQKQVSSALRVAAAPTLDSTQAPPSRRMGWNSRPDRTTSQQNPNQVRGRSGRPVKSLSGSGRRTRRSEC